MTILGRDHFVIFKCLECNRYKIGKRWKHYDTMKSDLQKRVNNTWIIHVPKCWKCQREKSQLICECGRAYLGTWKQRSEQTVKEKEAIEQAAKKQKLKFVVCPYCKEDQK